VTPIHSELSEETEPAWVRPTVQRLLASLPDGYCQGLGAIVLTRTDVSLRRKRRRSRATRKVGVLGLYHPRWGGQPPWIELLIDEIVKGYPRPLLWIRPLRDLVVGRVLYHEIRHHLDATNRSVGRTGEHGAIAWEQKLTHRYLRQKYSYLRPLAPVFALLARFAKMMAASQADLKVRLYVRRVYSVSRRVSARILESVACEKNWSHATRMRSSF
jgi:hypothetical protein